MSSANYSIREPLLQYSTPPRGKGKLPRFLHRCKETCKVFWLPVALLGLLLLLGISNATINFGSEEKVNHLEEPFTTAAAAAPPPNSSEWGNRTRFKFTNGRLIYDPIFVTDTKWNKGTRFPSSEDFKYLPADPVSVHELEINSATLDAASLSKHIRELYNLRSVKLRNVLITGQFSRIYLPNLEKFYLDQVISPTERLADHKDLERLKSLLFFDKTRNQSSWSLTKDFASLGIELEVYIDGSKVLVANKTKSEVALTMSSCDAFLRNVPWPFDHLILGNCSVRREHIPSNLKSLLMGNVGINGGTLGDVLKSLPALSSFSGSIPNLKIHLSNLPSSLTFLCLTGIRLELLEAAEKDVLPLPASFDTHSKKVMPNIRQVAFGGDNLDPGVITQFDKIFPKVETVGIFGMGRKSYELLYNVLKTKAALIVIEFFPRESHPETKTAQDVEAYLQKIGVGKEHRNFVLQVAPDDPETRIGVDISEAESYFYRFTMLGWSKIDTFQKFWRVIEEGRVDETSVKIREENNGSAVDGIGGEKWPLVVPSG